MSITDALLDLALGGTCVGCARPGRLVCVGCRTAAAPRRAWPSPTPAGLAEPWTAGEYAGVLRAMVLEHKEEGRFSLGRPLGTLLAEVVLAAVGGTDPVVLVPVPSRPGVARRRGDDPTRRLVDVAARSLRREGRRAHVAPLLRSRMGVADQAGLGASARAANLALSMHCPSPGVRRLAATCDRARTVVCDDVLTTGATAREAQRALEAVGLPVAAIAVVAATRRRRPTGATYTSGLLLSSSPDTG